MDPGETIVAIGGMITGIIITAAIVWGVVQGLRAQAKARGRLSDPVLDQELTALRDHMDAMQQQLNETQDRLDFTERLLAQQRAPEQLPRV